MISRKDLKIEFRANSSFGKDNKYLEYRVSPKQDISNGTVIKSYLFGLFIRVVKKKHDTRWNTAYYFRGHPCYTYDDQGNWNYVRIQGDDLKEKFIEKFKTIGEFEEWLDAKSSENFKEYETKRKEYLDSLNNKK